MSDSSFSQISNSLPRVVIVGRPNVGKSTLFNRLVGFRKTITDSTPGVTRDPVEAKWALIGRVVTLLDTGGYQSDDNQIDALVARKSVEAIERADLVLLVIDVTEITPEDEELIHVVRSRATRTMLVVNKVDNEQREIEAWNMHSLGFDRVVHISAEHKKNFHELERVVARELDVLGIQKRGDRVQHDPDIRLALIGKPNTGKSTLLNFLLDEERSIVSSIPGTTRDVVEGSFSFKSKIFSILDTAGIRRKRSVHESVEYYSVNRAIGSIDHADVILLIVDATEGLTEQDKKIATQVMKRGKGMVLAFNKWDLMDEVPNALNAVRDRTRFLFPVLSYVPFLAVSARTGEGLPRILDTTVRLWKELHTEIPTGPLNRSLRKWMEQHPVPHGGGPRFVAKYMTQVSAHPLRFLLFVNRAKGFPESWLSYARNQLREDFGISSVPFTIELRES